jgi:Dolichyl-phosphate-mannose-protein mannosyltransferase
MALSLQHDRLGAATRAAGNDLGTRAAVIGVSALTAVAFALRVVGIDQTLYADEYFTHTIVTENDLSGVWEQVYHTSITPPLHYALAWFAVRLGGDSTILLRVPSLVLGTALVPLIFLLARRIGGARTGLLAAALIALSPFAIWYSDEGRAYATMMFLVALSTLALLRAVERGQRRWWVVYALAACAALWSHYTAVFVILAQAGWALWTHREHRRALVLAQAAVVVGYLPWLPGFFEQRQNKVGIEIIGSFATLSFGRVFEIPAVTLIGHPFLSLGSSPGARGLVLVVVLAALCIAATLYRPHALRRLVPSPESEAGLVLILALATPIGLLIYDVASSSLYLPRNLSASLPALAVALALLLDRLTMIVSPQVGAIAMIAFMAVVGFGAIESVLDDDQRRPAYREAAHYLDDVVAPTDPVVDTPLTPATEARFRRTTLDLYFERKHRLYAAGADVGSAWRQLQAGRNLFLVAPGQLAAKESIDRLLGAGNQAPPGLVRRLQRLGGPDGRAVLRDVKTFAGIFPISVFQYEGLVDGKLERHGGRESISWSFGKRVSVSPGVAVGAVENVTPSTQPLSISGWSVDAKRSRPADWVLFFSRDRLFAVSAGGIPRPDIARTYGATALLSGFSRSPDEAPGDRAVIRVFAVVGDQASELPFRGAARQATR